MMRAKKPRLLVTHLPSNSSKMIHTAMNKRFLYHAEAYGASGSVTLPIQEMMEVQASLSLPTTGGHGRVRVEKFHHRNFFSFRSAEAQVVGSYSAKDKAHGTLATA